MIHDARNTKTRYIHYTKFDQTCTSYSRSRLQTLLRRKTEVTVTVPPTAEPVLARLLPEENAVRECVMSHQPPFARQKSRTKEKERVHDQALSSSGENAGV